MQIRWSGSHTHHWHDVRHLFFKRAHQGVSENPPGGGGSQAGPRSISIYSLLIDNHYIFMQIRWSGGHIHHCHTMSNYIYDKTDITYDEKFGLNTSCERWVSEQSVEQFSHISSHFLQPYWIYANKVGCYQNITNFLGHLAPYNIC